MPSITLKGNAIEVAGSDLSVGAAAPDFSLQAIDLSEVTLATAAGKTRVIATVPSLDTPVCAEETKRFNDAVAERPSLAPEDALDSQNESLTTFVEQRAAHLG